MNVIYSVLEYYPTFLTTEHMNVGVLLSAPDQNYVEFIPLKKHRRLASFDDELDLKVFHMLMSGIQSECSTSIGKKEFNIYSFTRFYINELKFTKPETYPGNSIAEIKKELIQIYLRYDLERKDRPNNDQMVQYYRKIMKSYDVNYSYKTSFVGKFEEPINYDFRVGDSIIKFFNIRKTGIHKQINEAKTWVFNAEENSNNMNFLIVVNVDTDFEDYQKNPYFVAIKKIFSSSDYIRTIHVDDFAKSIPRFKKVV